MNNIYHKSSEFSKSDFTYLCPASSSTSLIDHIFCSQNIKNNIINSEILYSFSLFDHFPIKFTLDVKLTLSHSFFVSKLDKSFIDWNKVKNNEIKKFQYNIDKLINDNKVTINNFTECSRGNCNNKSCCDNLDSLFNLILFILISSCNFLVKKSKKKYQQVAGWNEYVKLAYKNAHNHFIVWKNEGKPLNCLSHTNMIESRRIFKNKFSFCKKNQQQIKDNNLAKKFVSKDKKQFWKDIKDRKTFKSNHNELNLEGETDALSVAERFSLHFKSIFDDDKSFDFDDLNFDNYNNFHKFSYFNYNCISEIFRNLKPYSGIDGVSNYHLKYASMQFINLFTNFINLCFLHNHVPLKMTSGCIEPLLKEKLLDPTKLTNYRPIIKSSIFLKVFENLILMRIKDYFKFNDNQHGFRKQHSTTTACFILKETILSYLKFNTPVYAAFLDISKAFDNVNHKDLIQKLLNLNIPLIYLKIIYVWYRNQNVCVNHDNNLSSVWKLKRGVRQGGILSPLFFNLYINDLLNEVTCSNIGCKFGIFYQNIIAYADDLVLLAPSISGLQKLINISANACKDLFLEFNTKKSVCIKFYKYNRLTENINSVVKLGNSPLSFVNNVVYLGFNLSFNLSDDADIIRVRNKFYASFNTILRKFYSVDFNIFLFSLKPIANNFTGHKSG